MQSFDEYMQSIGAVPVDESPFGKAMSSLGIAPVEGFSAAPEESPGAPPEWNAPPQPEWFVPGDAPAWSGKIPTEDRMRVAGLRDAAESLPEGSPEQRAAYTELGIQEAMLQGKAIEAERQHAAFLESGMTEEEYAKELLARRSGKGMPAVVTGARRGANAMMNLPFSLAARMSGNHEMADEMAEAAAAERERSAAAVGTSPEAKLFGAMGASDETAEWAAGIVDSASESTMQSLAYGVAGGMPAIVAGFSAQSFDSAYSEARKRGLDDADAFSYALQQGAIEGTITAIFGRVGNTVASQTGKAGSTIRRAVTGEIAEETFELAEKGMRDKVAKGVRGLFAELGEENTIEILSQVNAQRLGARDPITYEDWVTLVRDTSIQAAVGKGQSSAIAQSVDRALGRKAGGIDKDEADRAYDSVEHARAAAQEFAESNGYGVDLGETAEDFAKATGRKKTSKFYRDAFRSAYDGLNTGTPETEATTAAETAPEPEVRPESPAEPPTQQEAAQETSEETTQEGVPEEAPAPPESGTMVPQALPEPTQEGGVGRVGESGQAVVDNMYTAFQESLEKTGELPQQERSTNLGRLWDVFKGQVSPEEFIGRVREAQPETPDQWAALANEMVQDQQVEPTAEEAEPGKIVPEPAPEAQPEPTPEVQPEPAVEDPGLPPRQTFGTVSSKISEAATSPEEAKALIGILAARARSSGESPDEYVGRRIADIKRTQLEESAFLKYRRATGQQTDGITVHGEYEPMADGRFIIRAFEGNQDVSTLAHELGHVFRRDLADVDLNTAEQWAGVRDGAWEVEAEEKFARGFERYLADGKAPTEDLRGVFKQYKKWMREVYRSIKESPLNVSISPEMRQVLDRMLGAEEDVVATKGGKGGDDAFMGVTPRLPAGSSDKAVSAQNIIKTWSRIFNVPNRVGFIARKRAAAIYKRFPQAIRTTERHIADLGVAIHEIAHHLDNTLGITGKYRPGGNRGKAKLPRNLHNELRNLDYDKKAKRVHEGWAEFLRYYVTAPEIADSQGVKKNQAELQAPEFYKYFTGEWAKQNPAAWKKIQEAKKQAESFADQTLLARLTSMLSPGKAQDLSVEERFKEKTKSLVFKAKQNFFNYMQGMVEFDRLAAEKGWTGLKLGEVAMHYYMAEGSHAEKAYEMGVHDVATTEVFGKAGGLWDTLKENVTDDADYEQAMVYSWARHTKFMAEKNPLFFTGMSVEEADDIMGQMTAEQRQRYENVAKHIANYNNDLIEMLVRAGAIGAEDADKMIDDPESGYGDNYFPLHRVSEDGKGAFGKSGYIDLTSPVRRRSKEGSGRPIVDPIEATMARAIQFYKRAGQARVQKALIDTIEGTEGLGMMAEELPTPIKPEKGQIREILKTLADEGIITHERARNLEISAALREGELVSDSDMQWFADYHKTELGPYEKMLAIAERQPDALAEIFLWRPDYTPVPGKKIAVIHDNDGKTKRMFQFDEQVYDSLSSGGPMQMHASLKILRSASQLFKTGAVGLNTGFAVANLMRDYLQYQFQATGRSKDGKKVDWKSSLTDPWAVLGAYAKYKYVNALSDSELAKKFGADYDRKKDVVFDLFDEMGGQLYSLVAETQQERRKARRDKLGQSNLMIDLGKGLGSVKGAGNRIRAIIEAAENFNAISDAPPRIAEMLNSIRRDGYEPDRKANKWRNLETGELVDRLDEAVLVRASNAASEATVNFKRVGVYGRAVEALLLMPFYNATVQSLYRQGVTLAPNAKKLFGKELSVDENTQANRVLAATAASIGAAVVYWILRHDDDDYKEQEDYLKEGYWTFGAGGWTVFRIPKPREFAFISNITEGVLSLMFDEDPDSVTEVVTRDVMNRLPSFGGPVYGGVEQWANKDTFRERPIEPDYMLGKPPEQRFGPYTSETSKAIGQVTGEWAGISPLRVDHFLSSATGGAYNRWVRTLEGGAQMDLKWSEMPFFRGVAVNRQQVESVNEFYQEKQAAEYEAMRNPNDPMKAADSERMKDYSQLMASIRAAEPRGLGDRRDFSYEKYLVGLARDAMGKEPLESNPNPLTDPEVPEKIKGVVREFTESRAERAALGSRFPSKIERASGQSIEDAIGEWQMLAKLDSEFLEANLGNPVIRKAIADVVLGPQGQRVQKSRMPRLRKGENAQEYSLRMMKWRESKRRLADWQGRLSQ